MWANTSQTYKPHIGSTKGILFIKAPQWWAHRIDALGRIATKEASSMIWRSVLL